MAQMLTCKICLLTFDDSERQVQTEEDDVDEPLQTLSHKLLSIGFFQHGIGNAVPCHLCSWCAARVEDAYDLKQQCMKASQALKQDGTDRSLKESPTVETLLEEVTTLQIGLLPSLVKSNLPGLIRISTKGFYNARTVSNILGGAHDMFICIRNLSSSLKMNAALLANAVQFTENTLSFITVLLSMKEISAAMTKSAETMRNEAKLWKTKSAMVSEATDFIEYVSTTNVSKKRQPQVPKNIHEKEIEQNTDDLQEEQGAEELGNNVTTVHPDSFETATDLSLARPPEPSGSSSIDLDESEDITELETLEEQSVRRSLRSRSMVDTLVYWPKFKKQPPAGSKLSISKSKPCTSPLTSPQALDRLLLRRDVDSESDTGSNEKWAIVKKRKSPSGYKSPIKRPEIQSQSGVPVPSMDCTPVQNGCKTNEDGVEEDESKIRKIQDFKGDASKAVSTGVNQNNSAGDVKLKGDVKNCEGTETNPVVREALLSPKSRTCNICGKTLKCNRNLQAHMNMHTGSSPYKCHFCPKLFTSSWNRIQHERVHTGLKPYKCNLCEESFRYNVTLRHHKSRVHDTE